MDIPARQVTAFIGPSGCGKSTFLKCFNRMNDLVDGCRVSGDFRIGDVDIYGKIDINDLRRNVGMVFQKPNPFPMSVYDNIAYGPRTFGIRKRALLDGIVEESPARRRHVGRAEGSAGQIRPWTVRRSAAAALHRACPCRQARHPAHG